VAERGEGTIVLLSRGIIGGGHRWYCIYCIIMIFFSFIFFYLYCIGACVCSTIDTGPRDTPTAGANPFHTRSRQWTMADGAVWCPCNADIICIQRVWRESGGGGVGRRRRRRRWYGGGWEVKEVTIARVFIQCTYVLCAPFDFWFDHYSRSVSIYNETISSTLCQDNNDVTDFLRFSWFCFR